MFTLSIIIAVSVLTEHRATLQPKKLKPFL